MGHQSHNYIRIHPSFNIILFGETGVGKSSVINLIAGTKVAETSHDGRGCTLESRQYTFQVANRTFHIWDTVGLGEPVLSSTNYLSAIEKGHTLIQQIGSHGGLDLLLFCIPGSSVVTQTIQCNYRLFFEVLCEKRIPIAAVVTHLEDEEKMEEWWSRNEKHVNQRGLKFSGHACVTGLPEHSKEAEGRDSLERLLLNHDPKGRYTMPPASGRLLVLVKAGLSVITPQPKTEKAKLERLLRNRCMMDGNNAQQLAETLARHPCNPSLSTQDHKSGSRTGMRSSFNIILFGEAGVGKSSVINLIAEKDVAKTSPDARGCTMESNQYTFDMAKRTFNIWDTVGLGEPTFSVSNCLGAIEKAYLLIQQVKAQGGLDLLLFCISGSGSRISQTMICNYILFFEVLCEKRIPIAVVVTRLEDENRMEDWWNRNTEFISQSGLQFGGHACITGRQEHQKAAEGRSALKSLFLGYDRKGRYPMPPASNWFFGFLERLRLSSIPRSKALKDKQKELERLLHERCMMNKAKAQELAESLTHPREHDR